MLPVVLFLMGLVLTLLFVLNIELTDATARLQKLEAENVALATRLERESSENGAYLKAAASLFSISDDVSQGEFAKIMTDMSEEHNARGSLGMGWTQWIRPIDIPAVEARIKAYKPGAGDRLKVRPPVTDPNAGMAVVAMIAPLNEENLRSLGFNMYSEPLRRAAIDAALTQDRPIATGRVRLVQDRDRPHSWGTIIFLPVFARQNASKPQGGRLKGFVYSPVRVDEVLRTALNDTPYAFGQVALYDGPVGVDHLMAATGGPFGNRDSLTRQIDFAGRKWTLVIQAHDRFGLTSTSVAVLCFGFLSSLFLMWLARRATSRAAEDRKVLEWLSGQSSIRNSLTRELNHRVKNTLANVLSIVALTRRRASNIDEFADGLTGRIRALSATHDLLSLREWRNAPVYDVVESELAPYLDPEDPHAEIGGPDALLAPNDAMSLGLALHELATNAAKYGALSVPTGKVSVNWSIIQNPKRCLITWKESGGPPVNPPQRRGFGIELIEKIVSHELDTKIDLRFDEAGVTCTLAVPLRDLQEFVMRQG